MFSEQLWTTCNVQDSVTTRARGSSRRGITPAPAASRTTSRLTTGLLSSQQTPAPPLPSSHRQHRLPHKPQPGLRAPHTRRLTGTRHRVFFSSDESQSSDRTTIAIGVLVPALLIVGVIAAIYVLSRKLWFRGERKLNSAHKYKMFLVGNHLDANSRV